MITFLTHTYASVIDFKLGPRLGPFMWNKKKVFYDNVNLSRHIHYTFITNSRTATRHVEYPANVRSQRSCQCSGHYAKSYQTVDTAAWPLFSTHVSTFTFLKKGNYSVWYLFLHAKAPRFLKNMLTAKCNSVHCTIYKERCNTNIKPWITAPSLLSNVKQWNIALRFVPCGFSRISVRARQITEDVTHGRKQHLLAFFMPSFFLQYSHSSKLIQSLTFVTDCHVTPILT
jgi:hypothetical protein